MSWTKLIANGNITLILVVVVGKFFTIKNLPVMSTLWIVAKMLCNDIFNLSRDNVYLPQGALLRQTHSMSYTINP